jgi:hypothetical protein
MDMRTLTAWIVAGSGVCCAAFPLVADTGLAVVRGLASQSSNLSPTAYQAALALDTNVTTFTHTANLPNSYWEEDLGRALPISRIELVNRHNAAPERLGGLTLRVFDSNRVSVVSATVTNPGLGGTWTFDAPSMITGQFVRVGLENGVTNQGGNYYVTLAEVRVLSEVEIGTNVAVGKDAFMTRLTDALLPPAYANDNCLTTSVFTTTATVDGYWEVDLGALYAISRVRAIEAAGLGNRLAHATVRFFNESHESVFSRHLTLDDAPLFSFDVGDVYCARYVRVGLENKERTGGDWYLGFKEVQVFGRPAGDVGILAFGASQTNLTAGQSATLSWQVRDVRQVLLCSGNGPATNVTGMASLLVAPAQSTCYTLVANNAGQVYERSVTVVINAQPPPLRIEEFVADNKVSFEDGYGDAPDWIEIRNPTAADVNLSGYGLSDNPSKPMKWTFPSVTLPAYGRMVVCASGKAEKIDPAGYVHASWSLSADGEHIALTAPDGTTGLDQVLSFPEQGEDVAYARDLDGGWGFQEPTPGALNRTARYAGWLKSPDFSQTRGFYTNAFNLALQDENAGATLLYSTNGTLPALVYSGPISISRTTSVRATAIRSGFHSPRTKTHTFIFPEYTVTSPAMNKAITQDARYATRIRDGLSQLPTFAISLPANMTSLDDYAERECSMEILWPDGSQPPLQANCGFEQFGGAYQNFIKKSWRLNFRREFGTEKLKASLLQGFDHGFPARDSFNKIELRSGSQDMADRGFYMAARFVDDSLLDMGSLNPHGRYVHLYLNGDYWGQYDLREALDDAFLANYLGGKQSDYLVVRGNDNAGSSFVVGTPDPIPRYSWYRARELGTSYHAVKPYLDVANLVDFMLLWWYGNCESEYRCAGSVEAGSGFKFWMADSDGFLRVTTANTVANTGPGGLMGKLRSDPGPDFKMLVADRIYKHFFNDGALTPARMSARLSARTAEIQDSIIAECARWGYRTPDTWADAAATIQTNMFPARSAQVFGYLRSAGLYPAFDVPALSQQGGLVTNGTPLTLSSSAGTVYYTLDGSDPRLPGGGLAPGALLFSAQNASATLIASNTVWRYWDRGGRDDTAWLDLAFDDSTWSNGAAELGYGDSPATAISYGPSSSSKHITSYFRKSFYVQDASAFDRLNIRLLRDDGAVLYLNGAEILRSNMPAGTILSNTVASVSVNDANENTYFTYDLPSEGLLSGTNLLAVEIHQNSGGSSDLSFNLHLSCSQALPSAPIPLTSNTVVKSRVWTGSVWSALNEASFYLPGRELAAPSNLLVTELHYDPPGETDKEQFVELLNVGSNEVDLAGVALTSAVTFTFPSDTVLQPGELILVVEDADVFASVYQTLSSPYFRAGLRVAGEWAGALAKGGETLRLLASNGVEIASVAYAPDGDWPARASGRGSSLELADVGTIPATQPEKNAALNAPSNWRSSSLYQGSPGRLDSGGRALVINEILSHTDADEDWIELRNVGSETADLSGLCLSDDWNDPFRYVIPEETGLDAGQHIRFTRAQLGFGFSELGSDALLIGTSGTSVHRFLDTVDFPAAAREEPFGRFTRSDGTTDFTELRASTPAAANALPRVGPVVISEIMAEPAAGCAEYVVLCNLSDRAVALYDTNHVANTWELSGAVEFRFPASQALAPRSTAIVCATSAAAFRAQYGVDAAVPVYGPWSGQLNNAGESLKLRQPGDPEPEGDVPYYRADRVVYSPLPPWPAVTAGVSIVRVPLEGYGNEPACWQAAAPGTVPGSGPRNRAPTVQVTGTAAVNEGEPVNLSVSGADADVPWQTVSVTADGTPAGAAAALTNGLFTWVTGEADGPGTYAVRFLAADTATPRGAATQTVWVTVNEVNQPPSLTPWSDFSYPVGAPLELPANARDDDLPAQTLRFTQSGLPQGLAFDVGTGLIDGSGVAQGVYPVVVVVSDDQTPALAATNAFALTLTEPMRLTFEAAQFGPGTLLSVPTLPGEAYRIEYTDRLVPADWRVLRTLPAAASNAWTFADPAATNQTQRFYRMKWLR